MASGTRWLSSQVATSGAFGVLNHHLAGRPSLASVFVVSPAAPTGAVPGAGVDAATATSEEPLEGSVLDKQKRAQALQDVRDLLIRTKLELDKYRVRKADASEPLDEISERLERPKVSEFPPSPLLQESENPFDDYVSLLDKAQVRSDFANQQFIDLAASMHKSQMAMAKVVQAHGDSYRAKLDQAMRLLSRAGDAAEEAAEHLDDPPPGSLTEEDIAAAEEDDRVAGAFAKQLEAENLVSAGPNGSKRGAAEEHHPHGRASPSHHGHRNDHPKRTKHSDVGFLLLPAWFAQSWLPQPGCPPQSKRGTKGAAASLRRRNFIHAPRRQRHAASSHGQFFPCAVLA